MVRPRIGSFVYLPDEVETMEAEVKNLREFVSARRLVIGDDERIKGEDRSGGVQGIVIGALTPNGGVDLSTMTR